MKVKKFISYNIIITIIIIFLLLLGSNFYNKNIDPTLKKFINYNDYSNKSIDIVNVGSSHGMLGIKYTNNQGMNLALSAQNYYYDLKLLKKYSNKIKNDAIIIIPVSIFSFYNSELNTINKNYIKFLKYEEIKNISKKDYFLEKYFSIVFPFNNIIKLFKTEKEKDTNIPISDRKKWVWKVVEYHLGMNSSKVYAIKNSEEDLKELLLYIKSKSWKPILITTPFTYIYNNEIKRIDSNAYYNRIYKNIELLKQDIDDIVYLDYSHDERFLNNLEYFSDSDHLNKKGAEYFTEILLKDINEKVGNR